MERLVIIVIAGAVAVGAPAAARDPAPKGDAAARAALWEALGKAKPKDLVIESYAENSSLDQVCFSAGGRVYLFAQKDGKVTEMLFMKVLPKINRISFRLVDGPEKETGYGDFELWANGRLEMTFSPPVR